MRCQSREKLLPSKALRKSLKIPKERYNIPPGASSSLTHILNQVKFFREKSEIKDFANELGSRGDDDG